MERVEPFINEATNHGWVIFEPILAPYSILMMLKAFNAERPFSPEYFLTLLSRVMRRYYLSDSNVDVMKEEWEKHEWSRMRWPIFLEAIDCYKRGAYFASISTTAPLVEGILTYRGDMKPFSRTDKLKKRVREIDESGKLAEIVDRFFADTRSLDDFIEGSLNRHAILHGMDVKFGTQEKALQVIAMLNALVYI